MPSTLLLACAVVASLLCCICGSALLSSSFKFYRRPIALCLAGSGTGNSPIVPPSNGEEVEKYKLRTKILEEALLALRVRYDAVASETDVKRELKKLQTDLKRSETNRNNLQLIIEEAEKDVMRFQERTRLLEKALSKSRDKAQSLERSVFDANKANSDTRTEVESLRRENTKLLSAMERYKRELAGARKASVATKATMRDYVDEELDRLSVELEESRQLMVQMEKEYSTELGRLQRLVDSSSEREAVKMEQMQLLLQSARTEAAELKVAISAKERMLNDLKTAHGLSGDSSGGGGGGRAEPDLDMRLERTAKLLEDTISLLADVNANSRRYASQQQDQGSTVAGGQAGAAADYLIAGDLRDQRRILEMQSDLLGKLSAQIQSTAAAAAAAEAAARDENGRRQRSSVYTQQQQVVSDEARWLPVGHGVPITVLPTASGVGVGMVRTSRQVLHSVKRGLGFLVGLDVPPYSTTGTGTGTGAGAGSGQGGYIDAEGYEEQEQKVGWEEDLSQLLNG
jgi:hypothetical protein